MAPPRAQPPRLRARDRRVFAYYREFLSHPDDARKVAWRTRFDQELRFENLLEAVDEADTGLSILDVGCGLGDLYSWLRATGREGDYLGVDIVPEMIEAARARHPAARFEVCDVLVKPPEQTFDLVVCSGGLTVRTPEHERFVLAMIDRMLALSHGAVAINFQSTRAFAVNPLAERDPDLFHADPLALYAACRERCRWTVLREDMLPTDLTIYLYPGYARSHRAYARRAPQPDTFGLAWLLLERRLPQAALQVLDADVGPPEAPLVNLRGVALRQLGERAAAEEAFREALRLDPGYEPARLNLG